MPPSPHAHTPAAILHLLTCSLAAPSPSPALPHLPPTLSRCPKPTLSFPIPLSPALTSHCTPNASLPLPAGGTGGHPMSSDQRRGCPQPCRHLSKAQRVPPPRSPAVHRCPWGRVALGCPRVSHSWGHTRSLTVLRQGQGFGVSIQLQRHLIALAPQLAAAWPLSLSALPHASIPNPSERGQSGATCGDGMKALGASRAP